MRSWVWSRLTSRRCQAEGCRSHSMRSRSCPRDCRASSTWWNIWTGSFKVSGFDVVLLMNLNHGVISGCLRAEAVVLGHVWALSLVDEASASALLPCSFLLAMLHCINFYWSHAVEERAVMHSNVVKVRSRYSQNYLTVAAAAPRIKRFRAA